MTSKTMNLLGGSGRRFLVSLIACTVVDAANAVPIVEADSLKKLSLEELMDLEVTSVSRTEERFGSAAAAISVVTNETIRRIGATTIHDALRLVPGIHVASQTANTWAVSSRGFSSISSEKLLVLSDTRSIYTPLYSGVFWDVQDYLMEDIDRIEVIRGPGAALWGSNAVNGVINIVTRSARDTQGFYAEAGGGTEERAFAGIRYGGKSNGGIYFRVFGKYFDRNGSDRDGSFNANPMTSDDTQLAHIGFRADWDATTNDELTLQGDAYDGNVGRLAPSVIIIGRPGPQGNLEVDVRGGNVLGRWRRHLSDVSDLQLRAYYDHTYRDDPSYLDKLDTFDVDFQHRFPITLLRQQITWGLNYRHTSNRNEGKVIFGLDPASSDDLVVSGFLQDQIPVGSDVRLTLGTKLEHNDFSEFEVQPSVSAAWNVSPSQTLWSSVSRAVRVPTRLERDISIDVTNPAANPVARLLGNEDFNSEELLAYEVGFRWQAIDSLYVGVTAYHNRYHGLASLELNTAFVDPRDGRTVFPIVNKNLTDGTAQGTEVELTYTPAPNWRLTLVHTYTNLNLQPKGQDLNRGDFVEGSTPKHQFGLRSFLDLPYQLQLDAQLRHLTAIESIPAIVNRTGLPGYTEFDMRLAWLGLTNFSIELVGKNLLHDRHIEFGDASARGEVERSIFGKVTWRY